MSLPAGTRLRPYEIVAFIAAGGMGEVYRARDTKLGRDVAIKILPAEFAQQSDRLARFEREAQLLASLNHPHIAHIYGVEDSGGVRALAMELIEGQTLADLIKSSDRPSVRDALKIARQIAEALEAAHEKGIIHRDLKPGNVMIDADGQVKLLDFGLGKSIDRDPTSDLNSPTITAMATMAGVMIGTAAYMAPEQAKGRAIDKRTDLWAYGCVLYELLTGRRAFAGEDLSDTIAAIMRGEPDWSALPVDTPPPVRRLIQGCLQKDRRARIADVSAVRFALDEAEHSSATIPPPLPPAPSPRWGWLGALAVAAVVIVAMAVPTMRHLRETTPPETRPDIVTPRTDHPEMFALSPDGRQIVYVASGDGASRLWLRSLATTTATPLAGTEGATYPFWAPDSGAIGFFAGGALKKVSLDGRTPQTLALAFNGRGASWNADNVIVFAPDTTSALMRVSATGVGGATPATTLAPGQGAHLVPYFLPDGRRFVFSVTGAPEVTGIYLGALDGSAPTRLVATPLEYMVAHGPQYLPSGWLLWLQAGTLAAQRLDVAKAALVGAPVTVADGLAAAVSGAMTGLVAYRTSTRQTQLTWFDRSGAPQGTIGEPDSTLRLSPRASPDGHRVLINRSMQGTIDLWLLDRGHSNPVRSDAADRRDGVWSPDGNWIVFRSFRTGAGDLYRMLASGVGEEELIVGSDQIKTPHSWSKNGFLLYLSIDPRTKGDLWVVPTAGKPATSKIVGTPFRDAYGEFSPDGQWVAYQSDESGHMEIYVRPFTPPGQAGAADGERPIPVSTAGGISPFWERHGKELYYLNPAGEMMAVPITVAGSTLRFGVPVIAFPTHIYGGGMDIQQGRQYDVAPDGRFLINTVLDSAPAPITLLQNWDPAAKK
jgi:serine/threonine protein kinase/Tol biopolymer transport system component